MANTGFFDWSQMPEPRANATLLCRLFKFLQVKIHVSFSQLFLPWSNSGSPCLIYPQSALWSSETLTRLDPLIFQNKFEKYHLRQPPPKYQLPAPQHSSKRHISCQSLSTFCSDCVWQRLHGEEEATRRHWVLSLLLLCGPQQGTEGRVQGVSRCVKRVKVPGSGSFRSFLQSTVCSTYCRLTGNS